MTERKRSRRMQKRKMVKDKKRRLHFVVSLWHHLVVLVGNWALPRREERGYWSLNNFCIRHPWIVYHQIFSNGQIRLSVGSHDSDSDNQTHK